MNKFYADYFQFAKRLAEKENNRVVIEDRMENNQLSITPYIYNACSANCQFCSEKLVRGGSITVCNGICNDYADKFERILNRVKTTPLFLSLSGKEPTESKEQLRIILEVVRKFQQEGGLVTDKVMYSNLSGFAKDFDGLVDVIKNQDLTRIECSRHHFDEEKNQWIVKFKKYNGDVEPIKRNDVFAGVVKRLNKIVPVKLVCVLQKAGVGKVEEIIEYLNFAKEMGVTDVVFRELAMFGDCVELGRTQKYIVDNRVELMDLLIALPTDKFKINNIVKGYYYFSFGYKFGDMNVNFEMSDYEEMIKYHNDMDADKIYKLIYYPNGILCKDWNMKARLDWV